MLLYLTYCVHTFVMHRTHKAQNPTYIPHTSLKPPVTDVVVPDGWTINVNALCKLGKTKNYRQNKKIFLQHHISFEKTIPRSVLNDRYKSVKL